MNIWNKTKAYVTTTGLIALIRYEKTEAIKQDEPPMDIKTEYWIADIYSNISVGQLLWSNQFFTKDGGRYAGAFMDPSLSKYPTIGDLTETEITD